MFDIQASNQLEEKTEEAERPMETMHGMFFLPRRLCRVLEVYVNDVSSD